jgi:hypothetical protein
LTSTKTKTKKEIEKAKKENKSDGCPKCTLQYSQYYLSLFFVNSLSQCRPIEVVPEVTYGFLFTVENELGLSGMICDRSG